MNSIANIVCIKEYTDHLMYSFFLCSVCFLFLYVLSLYIFLDTSLSASLIFFLPLTNLCIPVLMYIEEK